MLKSLLLFLLLSTCLFGCKNNYYIIQPAGELNLISTRNYETKVEYSQLKTYAGVDRSQIDNAIANSKGGKIKSKSKVFTEINTFKSKSLNESIDAVVKSVSGGEYLTNAKIYLVYHYSGRNLIPSTFYIASGDVWGTKSSEDNIKGFKNGDKIVFTYSKELKTTIGKVFNGRVNNQYIGKILELKSATAIINLESGEVIEIPYINMVKL